LTDEKVSRRGYMKYAGAGIVVVAVAGVGGYYATRPGPSPTAQPTTVVQTVKETVTQAQTVTEVSEIPLAPGGGLPMTEPKARYKIAFSNGEMADPWRWVFVQDMENWANEYRKLGQGIDFFWTNSLSDSAKQLADVENLLAMDPDALILSPYESEPLDPAVDKCNEAGVPLFCIDRTVARRPEDDPNDMYIQNIVMDWFYSGRMRAKLLVDLLTAKNGEPKGNVVEIDGTVGSSPQVEYSVGVEDILRDYSDIKILDSQDGDWDAARALPIAEDQYSRFGKGEIDAVFSHGDSMSLMYIDAAKRMGREELLGYITGEDCYLPFLEKIVEGEGAFSVECPPYFGYHAMESAICFLNGEACAPQKLIPQRGYTNWVPGHVDILKEHIAACKKEGLEYPSTAMGNFDELSVNVPSGKPDWWEYGEPVPSSNLV
jgi:ribose transport system substrate-binding protein